MAYRNVVDCCCTNVTMMVYSTIYMQEGHKTFIFGHIWKVKIFPERIYLNIIVLPHNWYFLIKLKYKVYSCKLTELISSN